MTTTTAPKKATAGFIISLIAGIMILINALMFFALTSFVGSIPLPVSIPGMELAEAVFATIGMIGLVFAIIVIVGSILIYMPGKEIIGGILVLIFSILSIFIGGALGIAKK